MELLGTVAWSAASVMSVLDDTVGAVCAAVCLAVAILLWALAVPRAKRARCERGLRAFLGFERTWCEGALTFAYLFFAVAGVVLPAAALACFLLERSGEGIAFGVACLVAMAVFFQIALRLACELLVLTVRALKALAAMARALTEELGATGAPQQAPMHPATPPRPAPAPPARHRAPAHGAASEGAQQPPVPAAPPEAAVYPRSQAPVAAPAPAMPAADGPAPVHAAPSAAEAAPEPVGEPLAHAQEPAETLRPAQVARCVEEPAPAAAEGEPASGYVAPDDEAREPFAAVDVQASVLWDCPCGAQDNYGAFCGYCGTARSAVQDAQAPRKDGAADCR